MQQKIFVNYNNVSKISINYSLIYNEKSFRFISLFDRNTKFSCIRFM